MPDKIFYKMKMSPGSGGHFFYSKEIKFTVDLL